MRVLAFACVALTTVAVAACGSPDPAPSIGPPVSFYEDDTMSFEYPSTWNALKPDAPAADEADVILYQSTEPIASDKPRVEQLREDGVYIAWSRETTAPTTTPDPSFTSEVTIGGRPAVVTQQIADGDCAAIDGGELLIIRIDSPPSEDDIRIQACVRGPNVELTGAAIAGMLASVRWKS
jgi:hypothetical protein